MLTSLILLFGVIGVVGLCLGFYRRNPTGLSRTSNSPEPRKVLPYAKRKYFFSPAERSFYEVLRRVAPKHTIFAKVRLTDLVFVKKGEAWQSHRNRIDRKHVDFVVCDRDLAPMLLIELDDASHSVPHRVARDNFVDQVFSAAGLPLIHLQAQRGYQLDKLRKILSRYIQPEPGSAASSPAPDLAELNLSCGSPVDR